MKKFLSIILTLLIIVSSVIFTVLSTNAESNTSISNKYISTNPNGKCGVYKNGITIDGKISDWDESMLIAQGVANDDPRVYCTSSMHENPIDSYALFAAWDDANLYLMWEMKNVQDIVAPSDDYPLSQGWLYEHENLPYFIAINTGKNAKGNGIFSNGETIWNSGITWEHPIDTLIAASTNHTNGPYVYKTNSSGKFEYNDTIQKSIVAKADKNQSVSKTCFGIDCGYGKYNNRIPGDIIKTDSKWVDFYQTKHSKNLDYAYEISIPFSLLNIDKNYLLNNGISIMQVMTYGTSGMNSLPVDLSMSDNANKPYSKDPSSSQEKEDEDNITVPLAQIGKCSVIPTESSESTEPSQPTEQAKYLYGDTNYNNRIDILDATLIQQDLAQIITFDDLTAKISDVNANNKTDILDATYVQQYLAQVIDEFISGKYLII